MNAALPQVGAIARRSVVRTSRQPAAVVFPLIFPMLLLLVNSGGLEASTQLPGFPTDSFVAFALAVPFIQGALFSTMNAGTDLARDIQTGFLNRLSLTSMRGVALIAGILAGAVVLGLVQAAFYIAVGLIIGVDFAAGALGILVLFLFSAVISVSFGAIGLYLALRTGSGESIQGLFPLLFVFLFLSSMNTPRDLIEVDWFRFVATINPVSYLIECVRSLIITGWDATGARARLRDRDRDRDRRDHGRNVRASAAAGADVRLWPVASGVAWRTLKTVFTNPSLLFPSLLFPLFFFTAFAGGLSQVANVPGFDFPPGYTAFQFCFVLIQSAAFGGVFTGFGIARDFESGFARRLLLAAPNRSGIVLGYALAALVRWVLTATMLTVVALIAGMNVFGGAARRLRHVRARAPDQHRGPALGLRRRDALPDDPGRAGDADAGVPDPLLRARLRAAGAA